MQQEIAIESGQKNSIYDINKFLVPDEAYNTAQLSSNYEQGSILENNQVHVQCYACYLHVCIAPLHVIVNKAKINVNALDFRLEALHVNRA